MFIFVLKYTVSTEPLLHADKPQKHYFFRWPLDDAFIIENIQHRMIGVQMNGKGFKMERARPCLGISRYSFGGTEEIHEKY
jgi:hypothetical protein